MNTSVEFPDCSFLRNNPKIWNELKEMRSHIRKLTAIVEESSESIDNQISLQKIKLSLLQLKTGITENSDQGDLLNKEVNKLHDSDTNFKEELRLLKETEIASLQQTTVELHKDDVALQRTLEGIIANHTGVLVQHITQLRAENELLKQNQKLIQENSLAIMREELLKLQSQQEEMRKEFNSALQDQENRVGRRIDDTEVNITITATMFDTFQDNQINTNKKNRDKIDTLANLSKENSENIKKLKKISSKQHEAITNTILDVSSDMSKINSSLLTLEADNSIKHAIFSESMNDINDTMQVLNTTMFVLHEEQNTQNENTREHLDNVQESQRNVSIYLYDYKQAQEAFFNLTRSEIAVLRQGKEYVNDTLQEIINTQTKNNESMSNFVESLIQMGNGQELNIQKVKESHQMTKVAIQEQITSLKHHDELLNSKHDSLQLQLHQQDNKTKKELNSLRHMDNLLNNNLKSLTGKLSGPYLIFTAYPSQSHISYETAQKVIFDRVILNFGNYYSTVNGSFTCPVDGIYQSSVSVWSDFDRRAQVEVLKDNTVIIKAATHSVPGAKQHGSNQVNFECHRGEVVWLRGGTYGTLYTDEFKQNSFSTVLIHNLEHFPQGISTL